MKIQLTEKEIIQAITSFIEEELGEAVDEIVVECDYNDVDNTVLISAVYVEIL